MDIGYDQVAWINEQSFEPTYLTLYMDDKPLVRIAKDGTIEKLEGFTTNDEASLVFWEVLVKNFPKFFNRDA